jgi:hypothetical protein
MSVSREAQYQAAYLAYLTVGGHAPKSDGIDNGVAANIRFAVELSLAQKAA